MSLAAGRGCVTVPGMVTGKAEATVGRWFLMAWSRSPGAGAASHRDVTPVAPAGKQVLARGARRVRQPSCATGQTPPAEAAGAA